MAYPTAHRHSLLRDLGLLAARLVLGTIFIAHGWQKIADQTIAGTIQGFRGMGVPMPEVSAPIVSWLELIGGILLILGAFTPIVGILLAIDMIAAAILVHIPAGLFIQGGGWELVGALGAGALALAATGAGRFSLDHAVLGGRRRGQRSRATSASAADARGSSAA